MLRFIALCAFVAPALCQADPVRTDPAEHITVFTDAGGAHVVTLVGQIKSQVSYPLPQVINEKENGLAMQRNNLNAAFGLGQKVYFVRLRFVDGRLICEKFAQRPKDEEEVAARAAELFRASCS